VSKSPLTFSAPVLFARSSWNAVLIVGLIMAAMTTVTESELLSHTESRKLRYFWLVKRAPR